MTTVTKTLDVTRQDIDKGEPRSCCSCPVALALERLFPGLEIEASNDTIRVSGWNPDCRHEWIELTGDTPEPAAAFIFTLDTKGKRAVRPFSCPLVLHTPERN